MVAPFSGCDAPNTVWCSDFKGWFVTGDGRRCYPLTLQELGLPIGSTHLHLLVEADDERALSRGVRGFEIAAARRLNRTVGRRGRVFRDRYHAEAITTPRRARHALAYVLNNWRRHREDAHRRWRVDPFSSAVAFDGWRGLQHLAGFTWPRGSDALPVSFPTVWLLTTGWRRHGLIDLRERPGPRIGASPARVDLAE